MGVAPSTFQVGITIIEWTIDEFQSSNFQPDICPIKLQLGFQPQSNPFIFGHL